MREISRLTKETIHLGALDEDSIVYIHKIDSMYNLRMYSRIGRRNPLYSTAIGKVLLAWRDREEVKQILEGVEYKQSTSRTITSTDALLTVLDRVREQGYGEDNEEQEEGLRCIGVPVFDRFGVVIAGLSISFPTLRFSEERLHEYVAILHTAAHGVWSEKNTLGNSDYRADSMRGVMDADDQFTEFRAAEYGIPDDFFGCSACGPGHLVFCEPRQLPY
ncbi:hypothetical protein L1887_58972 [Cichorium endivia]|nr:hypothetical protein L1887_58972 [Cichorium endivia]